MLEAVLKKDKLIVLSGLALLTLMAWAYMFQMARDMGKMPMVPQAIRTWGMADLVWLFVMWAVMMVAMMTPSAAPVILTYNTIHRQRSRNGKSLSSTALLLTGYLLVWSVFSLAAVLAQWGLHEAALLSPMMVSQSEALSGGLLVVAGIYQWTPIKNSCLAHCRSPFDFFLTDWREGRLGALVMGMRHGAFCVGCCWPLMALLFVAGVMTLWWVAALTAVVLVEKVAPAGPTVGRALGTLLGAWGLAVLLI